MPSYASEKENMKGQLQDFFDKNPNGKKCLEDFVNNKSSSIVLNLDELCEHSKGTAQEFVENAAKYGMEALENAIIEIMINIYSIQIEPSKISIIGNQIIPQVFPHDIAKSHIGKIIQVHGLVNRTSIIHPMYLQAVFKCPLCGEEEPPITQSNPWTLTKPLGKCEGCNNIVQWEPVPEDPPSKTANSQEFTLQESYDDISSNRMPRAILCITFKEDLLNYVNCGDDIDAVCIVRAMTTMRKSSKSKFITTYLEVLSINKRKKDPESFVFTPEEEQEIIALSKDPDIYEKMNGSLAPSIYGHENEKEGILLSIFGSPEEKHEDVTIRGSINLLMVGDPSTAKSQLLRAAVGLSPRGMFANGRGTSAAGLTAAMHKSENDGEWEVSVGVLVLADGGIAAIDEFEKMREEDRVNVHEAMEQQTVTIDKAGSHFQFRARTALIAAANPTLGRYNTEKSIKENLPKFPDSLFSRFDLIFKVIDTPNSEIDLKVVSHIINYEEIKSPIDRNLLRKYIAYSKRIKPVLSKEAADELVKYFVDMRNKPTNKNVISLTYRLFQALKRLTLAHARSLLKSIADESDVDIVKRLFDVFINDTLGGDAMSHTDGRNAPERLKEMIIDNLRSHPMSEDDLRNSINCEDKDFKKVFTQLQNDGTIQFRENNLFGKEVYALTAYKYPEP